jgi:prophage antirepressor-like protein
MLGHTNPQKAIRDHCKEKGCTIRSVPTNGGRQNKKFIDEGNLYRLITNSELPAAEKFENWVFDDVLPTIRKTGGYVNSDDLFINTYLPYVDEQAKAMFKTNLSMIRKQNEIIALKEKEIEHKDEVIVGLVDEITLAEKRQVLNRVVRYKGANFQERWRELYKQYEMKYHINLKDKLDKYNSSHKPKLKNKVDYIDKIMNKVPELYEIACKLYEADVKELAKNLYSLNEEAI